MIVKDGKLELAVTRKRKDDTSDSMLVQLVKEWEGGAEEVQIIQMMDVFKARLRGE